MANQIAMLLNVMTSDTTRTDVGVTISSLGRNVRAAIDLVASSGIPWIQLDAHDRATSPALLDASARRDLVAALRRRELAVSGVDCFIAEHVFEDASMVDRAVGLLIQTIQLAGDLGRVPVSCRLPGHDRQLPGVDSIHEAVQRTAQRYGVMIADFTIPPSDDTPGSLEAGVVGVGVDPAALLVAGREPADALLSQAASIAAARLVDLTTEGMRGPIGPGGRLDVTGYAAALGVARFAGPVVIDSRQWMDPWPGVVQTCHAWRQVVQVGQS